MGGIEDLVALLSMEPDGNLDAFRIGDKMGLATISRAPISE